MNSIIKSKTYVYVMAMLMAVVMAQKVYAHNTNDVSHVAIGGYDPVAYFDAGKPMRGNGYHTATYNGATYLFSSKGHQEKFTANPEKYAPQYGGFCAYGVAVGKKFFSNPKRWKIVDGKLYLNLDKDIQKTWNKDISGYIAKAETNWADIEHKNPAEL